MSIPHYISYEPSEGVMHALGLEVITIRPSESLQTVLKKLKKQDCGLVFLASDVYENNQTLVQQYDQDFDLTLSIIQKNPQTPSLGMQRLNELMKRAVGVSFEGREAYGRERHHR